MPLRHTGAFLAPPTTATGPYCFKIHQTFAGPRKHSLPLFQACLPDMHTAKQCPCVLNGHRSCDHTPLPITSSLYSPRMFFVQRTAASLTHPRLGTATPFLCCPACQHLLWVWFHAPIGSQAGLGTQSRLNSHICNYQAHTLQRGLERSTHTSLYSLYEERFDKYHYQTSTRYPVLGHQSPLV